MMQPSNLVPEDFLMEDVAALWRKRFTKALDILHQTLSEPLNWQDISRQCAVSANYFHVMFRMIFGETPAAYQRRARMKQVLMQLCFEPEKPVTEIALDAGFSTSQNLAKVLQRIFGQSASQIRKQDAHTAYTELRGKVEHYVDKTSIESLLSQSITFTITSSPEQFVFLEECRTQNAFTAARQWQKLAPRETAEAVSLSPFASIYDMSLPYKVGYFCPVSQSNHTIPSHQFLTCTVRLRDSPGYLAAWEALLNEVLKKGYDVNVDIGLLEIVHNPWDMLAFSADMTLMLPIITKNTDRAES